jgi:hypothetical protein
MFPFSYDTAPVPSVLRSLPALGTS